MEREAMGRVRVGVSGWSYDAWQGDVYPDGLPRSRRLAYVGERFDTAEINGSFYSLQAPDRYRSWYGDTPASFRFAVKGSRFITHSKTLSDVEVPLGNFFASGVLLLRQKLGPVLWQLPESHRFDAARLASFLELLPKDVEEAVELGSRHDHRVEDVWLDPGKNHRIRHVLEARNESFFTPEAVRVLRRAGVALAVSHAGDWPMREELTAGFAYARLHGAPETYRSGYGPAHLDAWARKARAWRDGGEPEDARRITDRTPPRRKGRDVWIYFDNDAEGRAPRDARALLDRLGGV
jgi:uncharacterized protein YecE (DUF72 family)